jgi:hypothetical protein
MQRPRQQNGLSTTQQSEVFSTAICGAVQRSVPVRSCRPAHSKSWSSMTTIFNHGVASLIGGDILLPSRRVAQSGHPSNGIFTTPRVLACAATCMGSGVGAIDSIVDPPDFVGLV